MRAGGALTITKSKSFLTVQLLQSPPFRKRVVSVTVASYSSSTDVFQAVQVIPPPCGQLVGSPQVTYGSSSLSVAVTLTDTCSPTTAATASVLNGGQIAGIVIGAIVGVAIIVASIVGVLTVKSRRAAKTRQLQKQITSETDFKPETTRHARGSGALS